MDAATTAAPANSPQHMRALEYANRVRLARAALKREVKSGDRDVADVVRSCPWEVETMTVAELLRSQSHWGRTRTNKFLTPLAVSENRQIGRLTSRQREVLANRLEEKANLAA
ncbi:MAG: hypothetical protein ACR2N5_03980 [Solirubrobacterales bacterium]